MDKKSEKASGEPKPDSLVGPDPLPEISAADGKKVSTPRIITVPISSFRLDERPGRTNESDDQGSDRQTLLL